MSQQRMAGSQEFQNGVKKASQPVGGREHIGTSAKLFGRSNRTMNNSSRDHVNTSAQLYGSSGTKTDEPDLKGESSWNSQMQREKDVRDNDATLGAYRGSNIADYANISKSATQSNGDFSINTGNKYVNNAREHSRTNLRDNEGFALKTTQQFVNFADQMRDSNSAKSKQFAQATTQSYLDMNKNNQSTNIKALDKSVRSAPINDRAYGTMQGLNTYGDMYRYGREELSRWMQPSPMKGVEKPDFRGMYKQSRDDINNIKI